MYSIIIFTGGIYPVEVMSTLLNYTYTGHETFACRNYWLKKGYDFLVNGSSFNSPEAPSILGVGKNMVRSIRFWLKAFNLEEENAPTFIAKKIFDTEKGWDPYLEDINTIWLLHYFLIKRGYAKIYSDFFNDFRKKQTEFSFESFERFLEIKLEEFSQKTIRNDINVLKSNYLRNERKTANIEDSFTVFLQEINLLNRISSGVFVFNYDEKKSLDDRIFLFIILDNYLQFLRFSISFENLNNDTNSPGNVFCMTQNEIYLRLERISKMYSGVVFTEDAGIKELQITDKVFSDSYSLLEDYYAKER